MRRVNRTSRAILAATAVRVMLCTQTGRIHIWSWTHAKACSGIASWDPQFPTYPL
jgi:hypothetical protein